MLELTKVLPITLKLVDGKKVPIGGLNKSKVIDYKQGMKNFAIHLSDYPDIVVLDLDIKDHPLKGYIDQTYSHETRKGWHCFFQNTYNLTTKRQKQQDKFDLLAGNNWCFYDYNDPDVATYLEYNTLPIIPMPQELYDLVKTMAADTGEADLLEFRVEPLMEIVRKARGLWKEPGVPNIDNSSDFAFAICKELLPYTDDPAHIEEVLKQIPSISDKQSGRLLETTISNAKKRMKNKVNWRPLTDWRAVTLGGRRMYADIENNVLSSRDAVEVMIYPHTKITNLINYTRVYQHVEFMPHRQNKFVGDYYNLFNGFVEPSSGSTHQLYLDFLRDVICEGNREHYEYLVNYMAHMVQKPNEKPDVAIVLYGEDKGTGKDTVHTILGKIFKDGGYREITHEALFGKFNSIFATTLLGVAQELVFAGSHKDDSALKRTITRDFVPIEYKGKETVNVKNYLRLFITSNSSKPVRATDGERRYFVLKPNSLHKGDFGYWDEIYNVVRPEHLLFYLQNKKIDNWNPRNMPYTKHLGDIIRENQDILTDQIEDWWDATDNGDYFFPQDLLDIMTVDKRYMSSRKLTSFIFKKYGKENFQKSMREGRNCYLVIK